MFQAIDSETASIIHNALALGPNDAKRYYIRNTRATLLDEHNNNLGPMLLIRSGIQIDYDEIEAILDDYYYVKEYREELAKKNESDDEHDHK